MKECCICKKKVEEKDQSKATKDTIHKDCHFRMFTLAANKGIMSQEILDSERERIKNRIY
jgi:hypothetical protein